MNGYLLDTAVFLWMIAAKTHRLTPKVLRMLDEHSKPLYLSAVSSAEISIKYSLGKLPLKAPPLEWLPGLLEDPGLRLLEFSHLHAMRLGTLPFHHRDPFDRMLVCQALSENLTLVSPDKALKKYKVGLFW